MLRRPSTSVSLSSAMTTRQDITTWTNLPMATLNVILALFVLVMMVHASPQPMATPMLSYSGFVPLVSPNNVTSAPQHNHLNSTLTMLDRSVLSQYILDAFYHSLHRNSTGDSDAEGQSAGTNTNVYSAEPSDRLLESVSELMPLHDSDSSGANDEVDFDYEELDSAENNGTRFDDATDTLNNLVSQFNAYSNSPVDKDQVTSSSFHHYQHLPYNNNEDGEPNSKSESTRKNFPIRKTSKKAKKLQIVYIKVPLLNLLDKSLGTGTAVEDEYDENGEEAESSGVNGGIGSTVSPPTTLITSTASPPLSTESYHERLLSSNRNQNSSVITSSDHFSDFHSQPAPRTAAASDFYPKRLTRYFNWTLPTITTRTTAGSSNNVRPSKVYHYAYRHPSTSGKNGTSVNAYFEMTHSTSLPTVSNQTDDKTSSGSNSHAMLVDKPEQSPPVYFQPFNQSMTHKSLGILPILIQIDSSPHENTEHFANNPQPQNNVPNANMASNSLGHPSKASHNFANNQYQRPNGEHTNGWSAMRTHGPMRQQMNELRKPYQQSDSSVPAFGPPRPMFDDNYEATPTFNIPRRPKQVNQPQPQENFRQNGNGNNFGNMINSGRGNWYEPIRPGMFEHEFLGASQTVPIQMAAHKLKSPLRFHHNHMARLKPQPSKISPLMLPQKPLSPISVDFDDVFFQNVPGLNYDKFLRLTDKYNNGAVSSTTEAPLAKKLSPLGFFNTSPFNSLWVAKAKAKSARKGQPIQGNKGGSPNKNKELNPFGDFPDLLTEMQNNAKLFEPFQAGASQPVPSSTDGKSATRHRRQRTLAKFSLFG